MELHGRTVPAPRTPQAAGRPTLSCPLLSPCFSLFPLHLLCLLVNLMAFPLKPCSHVLPSAVGRIQFWLCCTALSHGPMRNAGFLGRWGACLPAVSAQWHCPCPKLDPDASAARHPPQTSTMPCHRATNLDRPATFSISAPALGLSSELPTLCGQLARRSTAKLCHNQAHMTC